MYVSRIGKNQNEKTSNLNIYKFIYFFRPDHSTTFHLGSLEFSITAFLLTHPQHDSCIFISSTQKKLVLCLKLAKGGNNFTELQ